MKKLISLFLVFALSMSLLCVPAGAQGFPVPESVSLTAAATYVVNLDTGLPVVEINIHERRSVASLTKLMTALLLAENVPDLDGTLITAPTAIYVAPITNYDSSTADIRPGETVTARTLLYAMLLPSGNEAAAIAAYYLGKENLQNFYAMMNARAKELGCLDTNFTNPHGLGGMDENNYSTAYDLFLIANACWQYDVLKTVFSSPSYAMPFTNYHATPEHASAPDAAYTVYSTVKMQIPGTSVYRDYIRGMKTGSTKDAGRNFVSAAVNKNGESFIGVVLGCPWDPAPDGFAYSFHDTANIYDWVFSSFSVRPSLDTTLAIGEVPVKLSSDADAVKLYPAEDMKTFLPNENSEAVLEKVFTLPQSVDAPVKKGDVLGSVTLRVLGQEIGTVDLLAGDDIAVNPLLYAFQVIKNFFSSTYFIVVLVLCAIFLLGYFGLFFYLKRQTKRRRAAARRRNAAYFGQEPPAQKPQNKRPK